MKFFVILSVLPSIFAAARIQLVNLEPEEAQRYITGQSLDLKYSKKIGTFPLGKGIGRYLEGEPQTFYRNGLPIENPEDYNEDVYEATQFHGQDGLGRAMFGYSGHNQARLEARNANGEVRGSYQYINPEGREIVVQYWSDSLGFHQTDNVDLQAPEPVTETNEVREARLAHQIAWDEAARLAGVKPELDNDDNYSQTAEDIENDEPIAEVSNQHQSLVRYPSLPYEYHISPDNKRTHGIVQDDSVFVEAKAPVKKRQVDDEPVEEEVEQYDPKGFFYSFEYPVSIIVENEDKLKAAQSTIDPVVVKAEDDDRTSFKATRTGETLPAAVHDVQVSPKQRLAAVATKN